MWRLLWLLVALLPLAAPLPLLETRMDMWLVSFKERDTDDIRTLQWDLYCLKRGIRDMMRQGLMPSFFNLFDNTRACYVQWEGEQLYLQKREHFEGVQQILVDNHHNVTIASFMMNQMTHVKPQGFFGATQGMLYGVLEKHIEELK